MVSKDTIHNVPGLAENSPTKRFTSRKLKWHYAASYVMSSKRIPEASSAKRKKPDQGVVKRKGVVPPAPKLSQRGGPATRKTKTGTKKGPSGGVIKPKVDKDPREKGWQNRAKNQKASGPTALEVQIFEEIDEAKLTAIEARCLMFVREFCQNGGNIRKAAISMGVPGASAMNIGMRYFRHDFTQKLLRENMLDISRDRKAISRLILQKTLEEADIEERFQEIGSHRARVSALELGAKLLGVLEKKVSVKGAGAGPVGIMVVPQAMTREEWEAQVTARQEALKSKASNADPAMEETKKRVRKLTTPEEKSVL